MEQNMMLARAERPLLDPKLQDEPARQAALERYDVLDTPPEEPFERITALVKTVLGVPISTISLIDTDRQWFKSQIGLDFTQSSRDSSFCTQTIRTHEPLLIPDTHADPRFAENPAVVGPPFIGSYLGVPLQTPDGYNIGSLCAMDHVARSFNPHQIEMLKSFAGIVVDELELRNLARLDQLTGAISRRSFLEEASRAIARLSRYDRPAALIMFDIDHFKLINDSYGHPAGDAVLSAVGATCQSLIRNSDSFGRLGGEEFAILLPDTGRTNARAAAERCREALAQMPIPGRPEIHITASFGIATLTPNTTIEQWLAAADAALYAAKHNGRNQCQVAGVDVK
jgi:diguanylate cyclase (GGDEF)-like protein